MKYLKLFDAHLQYNDFVGGGMLRPNVSHCIQENEVHYNPIMHDYSQDYLTIESLEDDNTIYLKASHSSVTKTVSASTDNGSTWTEYTSSTGGSGTTLATLNSGDKLLIKGENSTYATGFYNQLKTTGQFEVYGNIMSLVSGDSFANADELTGIYTFSALFSDCVKLTSAENLVLPATALTDNCYNYMFNGCTSLTTAPKLPALTLTDNCYSFMFQNCTSLTVAPELPATTLATDCYFNMFKACTSLTEAPELPATTLVQNCYDSMFYGCTRLTVAPELPAIRLASSCYREMFANCTGLTSEAIVPDSLVEPISSSYCTYMYCNCPITTPNGNYDSSAYECYVPK